MTPEERHARLDSLSRQIERHPGIPHARALLRYKLTRDILAGNGDTLKRVLLDIEGGIACPPSDLATMKQRLTSLDSLLMAQLHNWVAGAHTVVDHMRNMMNDEALVRPEHLARYQAKVDVLSATPIAKLVKGMRNYILHRELPGVAHSINLGTLAIQISLDWKGMSEGKWPRVVRDFMDARLPIVRLLPLVEEYETLVKEFHYWFVLDYNQEHGAALLDLERLQKEFRQVRG